MGDAHAIDQDLDVGGQPLEGRLRRRRRWSERIFDDIPVSFEISVRDHVGVGRHVTIDASITPIRCAAIVAADHRH
jgi:hypothetical protein